MAKSIIVDVRRAVVSGLRDALDAAGFESVGCTYGWEGGDDTARRDQIFTDRAIATHEPASIKSGPTFRNERMEFRLVVLTLGVGQKPEETDDHAIELGQIVEEFVAANRQGKAFGIDGLNWIIVSAMELNNRYASEGSMSEITYTLTYDARLT